MRLLLTAVVFAALATGQVTSIPPFPGGVTGASALTTPGAVNCTASVGIVKECNSASTLGGTLALPLGSAATPSLTFGVDTTTGIYRDASNVIRIAAAGVRIASFLPTGMQLFGGAGSASLPNLAIDPAGNTGLFNPSVGVLGLSSSGIEMLRGVSSGNVLIGGTTDGNYRMDVQKSGSAGTARFYDQTAVTGATSVLIQAGAGDGAGAKLLRGILNDNVTEKWSITRDGDATFSGATNSRSYQTASNCSSAASPAVCGSSAAGSVVVAAAATSVVVNTTAVTANSQILAQFDASLGTKLAVTCNTTAAAPTVTARVAGTSFTITVGAAPATNPACYSYTVVN